MRNIGKTFPGVRALNGVSLTVQAGEVLALVGENGAGKSTLMRILAGAEHADSGEIAIDGAVVQIDGPRAAEHLGIGMIYQEFNLVPAFNAIENVVLGREPMKNGLIDDAASRALAEDAFKELGVDIPLDVPIARMSVAHKQLIEIAKALSKHARIIVMDEPTAALTENEIDRLFEIVARLRASGAGIVYISHRLEELPRIADRVTILRDGEVVETRATSAFPTDDIVRAMVGRPVDSHFPALAPIAADAPVVLDVRDLVNPPMVNGVSFTVRAGEIVGLAGLVGAGRTDICRAIAGADIPRSGVVSIDGTTLRVSSPHDGIEAGIAFVTEDRKSQGLVLGMSVRENVTLAHLAQFVNRFFLIDRSRELTATGVEIADLQIRTPGPEQLVRNLSGGNQQKVVLAKWLLGNARVVLFDEPTRGIDVGAKIEIYNLMIDLAKKGVAIVMVSSELPEVLGMAHRVFAVRGGRIVAEFGREEATPDKVIAAAAGAPAA